LFGPPSSRGNMGDQLGIYVNIILHIHGNNVNNYLSYIYITDHYSDSHLTITANCYHYSPMPLLQLCWYGFWLINIVLDILDGKICLWLSHKKGFLATIVH
jgi:hypothetical protein